MTENIPKRGRPPKLQEAYQLKPATPEDQAIFRQQRIETNALKEEISLELQMQQAKIELEEKIQPMHMAIYQNLICCNKSPDEAFNKATQAVDFYRAKVYHALERINNA